jgi:hypothetical protein
MTTLIDQKRFDPWAIVAGGKPAGIKSKFNTARMRHRRH